MTSRSETVKGQSRVRPFQSSSSRRRRFVWERRRFSSSRRRREASVGFVGSRRPPPPRGPPPPPPGPLPQLLDQPLEGELPVPELAALVLGDRAEHWAGAADDAAFLRVRQRVRGLDVEDGFDARLRLLRVLTARAARTRVAELHLAGGENDRSGHANRLAVHGSDSA